MPKYYEALLNISRDKKYGMTQAKKQRIRDFKWPYISEPDLKNQNETSGVINTLIYERTFNDKTCILPQYFDRLFNWQIWIKIGIS